jgi:hypothetical protein
MKPATAKTVNGLRDLERLDGAFGVEANLSIRGLQQECIRAELTGLGNCQALGLTARGAAPVLSLCRALNEAGHDPAKSLEVWRAGTLALRIHSIGHAARLTVEEDRHGRPRFRRWRERGCGAGSPVAQNEGVPPWAGQPGGERP